MRQRTCECGHTRSHPEVAQDPEYTLWGWIQLSMIGITPRPDRIVFRCRRCKMSLGVSRDPELLKRRAATDAPATDAPATAAAAAPDEKKPASEPDEPRL